jgi:hypothetical protein
MATRYYLPSTGAAPVSPAFGAGWTSTTSASRLKLIRTKISSAFTEVFFTSTATVSESRLVRQYVSDPFDNAIQITGTVKGVIRCRENNNSYNGLNILQIFVVSNTGGTVRGTLISQATPTLDATTEFANASLNNGVNRRFRDSSGNINIPLTPVTAQAGDRLVIEIGIRNSDASTSTTGFMEIGDNSATDLAENDTASSAFSPWIEFSQSFFASALVRNNALTGLSGLTGGGNI